MKENGWQNTGEITTYYKKNENFLTIIEQLKKYTEFPCCLL